MKHKAINRIIPMLLFMAMVLSCAGVSGCAVRNHDTAVQNHSESITSADTQDEEPVDAESVESDTIQMEQMEEENASLAENTRTTLSRQGCTLEQVLVLSRHNIRAPLSGPGSALDTMTPHKWFDWSAEASQLSVRGGVLETEMGQYFRK